MSEMATKIQTLWPEIILTGSAFAVMIVGLSPKLAVRRATYPITASALLIAAIVAAAGQAMGVQDVPAMALFVKVASCLVGLVLLMGLAEVPDELTLGQKTSQVFDPNRTSRGEFYGFFLLSLTGLMLCAGADDLIWLFLALELTSLPTYVMVANSRRSLRAPEAAVKYFFLGALSAAITVYGFALLYGATGSTMLPQITETLAAQINTGGQISTLALAGVMLSVLGVCFKIAAVPMHAYTPDVYQGAATPVSAFLAYVPKAAGFVILTLVLATVGWPLDRAPVGDNTAGQIIVSILWLIAALTMTVGNAMAIRQSNVKRLLAYSSVAHSGYMLVGLLAGPGEGASTNGIAAMLFYLVAYGLTNAGVFAVIGLLKKAGEEAETLNDLKGLAHRRPGLAAILAICVLSLLGMPPLIGFWGKLWLLSAAVSTGFVTLGVVLVINSALAAYYYLRIVMTAYMHDPDESEAIITALPSRSLAAITAAGGVVFLSIATAPLVTASADAAKQIHNPATAANTQQAPAALADSHPAE
ncbi:MAG: NADH-quinone oxidoreductase subunit N [Planctomycetota bacterium]|jgi:NADH-quinone oxidoreductase subunit N